MVQLRINTWQAAFFDTLEMWSIDPFVARIGIFELFFGVSLRISAT